MNTKHPFRLRHWIKVTAILAAIGAVSALSSAHVRGAVRDAQVGTLLPTLAKLAFHPVTEFIQGPVAGQGDGRTVPGAQAKPGAPAQPPAVRQWCRCSSRRRRICQTMPSTRWQSEPVESAAAPSAGSGCTSFACRRSRSRASCIGSRKKPTSSASKSNNGGKLRRMPFGTSAAERSDSRRSVGVREDPLERGLVIGHAGRFRAHRGARHRCLDGRRRHQRR